MKKLLFGRKKKIKKTKIFKGKPQKKRKAENDLLSSDFLQNQIKKVVKIVGRKGDATLKKELGFLFKRGILNRRKLELELSDLEEKIRKHPLNIDYRIRKMQLESSNPSYALEQAKNLLHIVTEDKLDIAYAQLSWAYASTRMAKESLIAAKKSLSINPKNALAKTCFSHAIQQPECFSEFETSDERRKAVFQYIEEALILEPDNFLFLILKCWAEKENDNTEGALKTLEQAKDLAPWEYEHLYYSYLASVYFVMYYREESIINSLKSVLLEPRSLTSMSMLSSSFDLFFDYESSLDLGEKFTDFHRENVGEMDESVNLFLAVNYLNVGNHDKAINICQECLKKRNSPRSHSIIANCLWYINDSNRSDEAIEHCEKAISTDERISTNGTLYSIYADFLFDRERFFEAGLIFVEAEKRNPNVYLNDKNRMKDKPDSAQSIEMIRRLDRIYKYFQNLIVSTEVDLDDLRKKITEEYKNKIICDYFSFGEDSNILHLFYRVLQWVDRVKGNYDSCSKYHQLMEDRDLLMERWVFVINICVVEKVCVKFSGGKDVLIPTFLM